MNPSVNYVEGTARLQAGSRDFRRLDLGLALPVRRQFPRSARVPLSAISDQRLLFTPECRDQDVVTIAKGASVLGNGDSAFSVNAFNCVAGKKGLARLGSKFHAKIGRAHV